MVLVCGAKGFVVREILEKGGIKNVSNITKSYKRDNS